ncbi:uncharacterized protein IL334_007565 [Kwoniella shivajii]|uniref:Enoyl reductase (ER) domain-containing protein n=1 Tax=Kwoniella shivajii TaxID=564305 RepID=A0ABZ1D909_9TREE|nr:hypothetical protein IL334_007565 [Kwoniella shivajii]
MTTQAVFKGWKGNDEKAVDGNLVFEEFEPKQWDEDDVEMKILYCGICGTDAAALSGNFLPIESPQICGHEIVGEVVRVGNQVENGVKVGSLVGVGYQSDSCRECTECKSKNEHYCPNQTVTFNSPYHRGHGKDNQSKGGFAKYWRGPSRFTIPLPEGLSPEVAGPLMCGGVTVFTPLERFGIADATEPKNVGVIGVGGLGHMGILFAKAMGANVTAISRSNSKKDDAMKLGVDDYIATGENLKDAFASYNRHFDLVIVTSNPPEFPINDYVSILKPKGAICFVGIVPKPLELGTISLISSNIVVTGSNIGSPEGIARMLKFAAEKKVSPWIQKWNMDDINKAMLEFQKGNPRYRYVLVNTDNGGKL